MAKSAKSAKSIARKLDPATMRYCSQPVQNPRHFDLSVDALRTRAIINAGKRWVNGTRLTY